MKKLRTDIFLKKAFTLAQGHEEIINFGIGETDFPTPPNIIEAAKKAFDENFTKYSPNAGIPELQQAIADKINTDYGTNYKKDNVIITVGGTEALYSIFRGLLKKEDEVLLPDPGFFLYNSQISLIGAKIITYSLTLENNFHPDISEIKEKITNKTKMIVINSPGNPTGTIFPENIMKQLAEIAYEKKLIIVTDEVYDNIIYPPYEHKSILLFKESHNNTIIVNSLSKTYSMTGWRIGYMILPEQYLEAPFKIHLNTVACASSFVQKAALEAITGTNEYLEKMLNVMINRKSLILNELSKIKSIKHSIPEGAFYILIDITKTGLSSLDVAEILLEKYNLVTMPGCFFGVNGDKYIRIAFAIDDEKIIKGVSYLNKFFNDYIK